MHFVFDNETEVWKRKEPAAHAAKKVRVELDSHCHHSQGQLHGIGEPDPSNGAHELEG